MDGLAEFLGDMYAELRTRGMKLPWLIATVAMNGSVLAMRMTDDGAGGLNTEFLAEHYIELGMMLPVNIMVIDATGEAVRVLITPQGMTFH